MSKLEVVAILSGLANTGVVIKIISLLSAE
jgi:hypothetical protein